MAIEHHTLDSREMIRLIGKAWDLENPGKEIRGLRVKLHFFPFEGRFAATVTVGPVAEVVLEHKRKDGST